jgi:hypothetical protein
LTASAALAILAAAGASLIRVDSNFLYYFKRSSAVRQANEVINQEIVGTNISQPVATRIARESGSARNAPPPWRGGVLPVFSRLVAAQRVRRVGLRRLRVRTSRSASARSLKRPVARLLARKSPAQAREPKHHQTSPAGGVARHERIQHR